MPCESCPLAVDSVEPIDRVFAKLAQCNDCSIERNGLAGRTVGLLREAGKETRKLRAEINRLKQELRDFQEGTDTDRSRIEKLEQLHTAAMHEVESALAERETALSDRDALVQQQLADIRALSSPILEISEGVLAVPLIGKLSEERTHDVMHALLTAVIARTCESVVLDLTGLNTLDEQTADRIASLCKAIVLVGARVSISGIQPNVVQTLVTANIDFSSVRMIRNLKDAIGKKK